MTDHGQHPSRHQAEYACAVSGPAPADGRRGRLALAVGWAALIATSAAAMAVLWGW